ncbi:LamG-like jellyroll fold domain-containing protein [Nonomuraea sp. NPDC050022]|uniref:LamG-like jellyroll fold domain-containing protein n=1 Tax=Nonomuraea sp. NPDC050022 TaxID=3364358 RepID=UPI003791FD47
MGKFSPPSSSTSPPRASSPWKRGSGRTPSSSPTRNRPATSTSWTRARSRAAAATASGRGGCTPRTTTRTAPTASPDTPGTSTAATAPGRTSRYFQMPVKVSEWIHYAVTFDTSEGTYGKVRIYRNGVPAGTDNLAYRPGTAVEVIVKPRPGSAPVRVGTRDGKSYFKGAVGKFAIYDRALSGAELRSHHAAMTGSAGPNFNADGVADLFSAATGTLTIWNGKGGNRFVFCALRGLRDGQKAVASEVMQTCWSRIMAVHSSPWRHRK